MWKMEVFQNTLQNMGQISEIILKNVGNMGSDGINIYIYSLYNYISKLIYIYKHLYIYAICLILKGMWKEPQAPVTVG